MVPFLSFPSFSRPFAPRSSFSSLRSRDALGMLGGARACAVGRRESAQRLCPGNPRARSVVRALRTLTLRVRNCEALSCLMTFFEVFIGDEQQYLAILFLAAVCVRARVL